MPIVNPSLAWGHIQIQLQTAYEIHSRRLYCREVNVDGTWATPFGAETDVATTVKNFHNAAAKWRSIGETVLSIDVFQHVSGGGSPTFITNIPVPTGINPGLMTVTAAAYLMLVMKAGNRQLAKFQFLDSGDAKPQRFALSDLDTSQQGLVTYLKDHQNICTIDGYDMKAFSSGNSGYNRRLAKRYGRVLAP